jgi:hypothetical protein
MIATIVIVTIAFLVCGNDFGDSGTSIGSHYNEECNANGDIDDNDNIENDCSGRSDDSVNSVNGEDSD